MAQINEQDLRSRVAEKADAYRNALAAEQESDAEIDLAWTHIRDVMEEQGQAHLLDRWLELQDVHKPLVTARNVAKKELAETVEQVARSWHEPISGRIFHPRIEIKNSLRVLLRPEYERQVRAVQWLVERGWGGLVTVKLPGGDWKLGTAEPKAADWKNEANLPRDAYGIPLILVDDSWPKPYIDGDEKWLAE